jgi:hypothetical protein
MLKAHTIYQRALPAQLSKLHLKKLRIDMTMLQVSFNNPAAEGYISSALRVFSPEADVFIRECSTHTAPQYVWAVSNATYSRTGINEETMRRYWRVLEPGVIEEMNAEEGWKLLELPFLNQRTSTI